DPVVPIIRVAFSPDSKIARPCPIINHALNTRGSSASRIFTWIGGANVSRYYIQGSTIQILVIDGILFDIRKEYEHPSTGASLKHRRWGWKTLVVVVVLLQGQANLFQVVDALSIRRGGAHSL